jgi:hypothetical protein
MYNSSLTIKKLLQPLNNLQHFHPHSPLATEGTKKGKHHSLPETGSGSKPKRRRVVDGAKKKTTAKEKGKGKKGNDKADDATKEEMKKASKESLR